MKIKSSFTHPGVVIKKRCRSITD